MEIKNRLSLLAIAMAAVPFMSSAEIFSVGNANTGIFTISGDAELNINYRDNKDNELGFTEDENQIDQDGRLLVEFAGERSLSNGKYVAFKGQPLLGTNGSVSLDDAYLEFGVKSNWQIKVGRFEAFDMFPKPQDVFVEYSGDTSNNLYQDGASYNYELLEARGRGGDGQILVSKTHDDLYLEVNFILGDRTTLFNGAYHGNTIDTTRSDDTIVARPVISYQAGNFNIALGAEANLIDDAIVVEVGSGTGVYKDVSERYGYGGKLTWSNDNWVINGMYAYLDAVDEENQTLGVTGAWKDIVSLGVLYSYNDYDDANWRVGDVDVTTVYGSYAFRDVMHIEDFSILLGAYFSDLSDDFTGNQNFTNEGGDAGGRLRLHYVF